MAVFVLVVATSKYVSLGSVTAGVLYPVAVAGYITVLSKYDIALNGIMALVTIILAILIVYCHRENLKRISQGTERQLSFGGKKDGDKQ
jgi:glycerol-3-phosphate acyltransferase PlsY